MRSQFLEFTEEEREAKMIQHLKFALTESPDNPRAHYSLAAYHQIKANKFDKGSPEYKQEMQIAIGHMEKVVGTNTDSITRSQIAAIRQLVQMLIDVEQEERARRRLKFEFNRIEPIAQQNPDEFDIWFTLVSCAVYLKDYEEANRIIQRGFQLANSPEVRQNIVQLASEVVQQQAESFTNMTDREQYRMRLELLCRGVTINPNNGRICKNLVDFIAWKTNPNFNESWLRDSVVGPSPGIIHVLLGVFEIANGNVLEGQKHWVIAEQQFANTQYVLNNVIAVAAAEYPDDFPNLQDMLSLALELFPDQPLLYQTRGVHLKNLGDFDSAIIDFEHAATKLPESLTIRQYLVDCYEQVGNTDKAFHHKTVVENMLGELDFNQRKRYEERLKNLR